MADLSVIATLLCDDVRKEITGKDILIGVYGGGLVVPVLPAQISFAVWIEFQPNKVGHIDFDIKINIPGKPTQVSVRVGLDVHDCSQTVAISSPQFLCQL